MRNAVIEAVAFVVICGGCDDRQYCDRALSCEDASLTDDNSDTAVRDAGRKPVVQVDGELDAAVSELPERDESPIMSGSIPSVPSSVTSVDDTVAETDQAPSNNARDAAIESTPDADTADSGTEGADAACQGSRCCDAGCGENCCSDASLPSSFSVVSVDPDNAMSGVTSADLIVVFSDEVDPLTLTPQSFVVTSGYGPVSGSLSVDGAIVTFTPALPWALDADYALELVETIASAEGNVLGAPSFGSTFHTAPGQWSTVEGPVADGAVYLRVATDGNGNAVAIWESSETPSNIYCSSFERDVGWDEPQLVEFEPTDARRPEVVMDGTGRALAVWQQSDGTQLNTWSAEYLPDSGWGDASPIENLDGDVSWLRLVGNADGGALAVWRQNDGTANSLWANYFSSDEGWHAPAQIDEVDEDLHSAFAAVDDQGNALAVWEQLDDSVTSIWANRFSPSGGWGTPTPIESSAEVAHYAHISMSPTGDAVVAWRQVSDPSEDLWAATFSARLGWGTPRKIETSDGLVFERPYVAMGRQGGAIAAWTQDAVVYSSQLQSLGGIWSAPTAVGRDDGGERDVSVVTDDTGAWILWNRAQEPDVGIWARRYKSPHLGTVAAEAPAQLLGSGASSDPHISLTPNGRAQVGWVQEGEDSTMGRVAKLDWP